MKGRYSFDNFSDASATGKGFLGGIYAGANFDIGNNVIMGADLDFTAGSTKAPENNTGYNAFATTQARWTGAARARLGYAVNRFLPYIAGGVAIGSFKDTLTTPLSEFKSEKIRAGWTIGGGVDYAVTDNVILRAEYRYNDFGKQSFDFNNSANFSRKLSSNDIRIGVAYKF